MTAVLGNIHNDLRIACEELNRRGCSARLCDVRYCGERDRRLVVSRPGGRVAVELLAPVEEAHPDRWHAVRIDQGRRTVWWGPARTEVVSGLDLVPFVDDLVSRSEQVLALKYRLCDSGGEWSRPADRPLPA